MFISVWDFLAASFGKFHANREVLPPGAIRPHAFGQFCALFPDRRCLPGGLGVQDMELSRHKSMDVPQAYVRDVDLFRNHAGTSLL
jgi:hypothetical protein